MSHGWTGGQYSLFRAILGLCVIAWFTALAPWVAPLAVWAVPALTLAGAALGALVAVGAFDRGAALLACALAAGLAGYHPAPVRAGLPWLALLLAAHACTPRAPYGSWSARGRIDPRGDWHLPAGLHAAAWVALALGYAWRGWIDLADPALGRIALIGLLELAFAPLVLAQHLRPWLWVLLAAVQLGAIALGHAAAERAMLLLVQLLAFRPAWIPPLACGDEILFYDGTCGQCHRWVRFVLAEDRGTPPIRFAPLGGPSFRAHMPEGRCAALPDSLVVLGPDGRLFTRSAAVLQLMGRLGGMWRALGWTSALVPRILRDTVYDRVAQIRHRLSARPVDVCPLVPPGLRQRFEN